MNIQRRHQTSHSTPARLAGALLASAVLAAPAALAPAAGAEQAVHHHPAACRARSHRHCRRTVKPGHPAPAPHAPAATPPSRSSSPGAMPVTGPGSPRLTPGEEAEAISRLIGSPSAEPGGDGLYGGGGGCKC